MALTKQKLAIQVRVVDIISGTTVDGPGFRTSIYFAGCDHHCKGCHNPLTWDHKAGNMMTIEEILKKVAEENWNVTFSGGDPMLQASQLVILAQGIREMGLTIWCYTGYDYEQVMKNTAMKQLLEYVDVLVDGRYMESQRDTALLFRGSANQRLIDVAASSPNDIKLWKPDF